jgi:hypothetical protein
VDFFLSTYVRKARVSQVVAAQRGRSPTLDHIDGREASVLVEFFPQVQAVPE